MSIPPGPRGSSTPPAVPSVGEAARQLARDLGQGAAEIAVWTVAVVVVVGGLGLLGHLLADGTGLLVGAAVGVVVLAVTWLVLVLAGVSLAARLLGGGRSGGGRAQR